MTNGDVKSNPWVIFHKTRPPSFTSFDSQQWSTYRTTARSLIYKKKFSMYEKKSSICEKKSSIYEVLGSFARKLQIMDNWLIFERDIKKRIERTLSVQFYPLIRLQALTMSSFLLSIINYPPSPPNH